jgi:hypothetical protein
VNVVSGNVVIGSILSVTRSIYVVIWITFITSRSNMGMCREWRTGRIPRFEDGLLLAFIGWIGRGLCRILLNPKGGPEPAYELRKRGRNLTPFLGVRRPAFEWRLLCAK